MEDAGNNFQPSKKRVAVVELSRDNLGLDDNETSEAEEGNFRRASDEVLATRRIVKVRRQQTPTPSVPDPAPTPAANPFSAIRLVHLASSDLRVASKGTEENDDTDSKYENKIDEPKGESAAEEKDDMKDISKQSESKFDEPKTGHVVEKDETNVCDQNMTKSVVEKDAESEHLGDDSKNNTEADNSENETKKDADGKINGKKYAGGKITEKTAEISAFSSFKPLSSGQNAFSGFTGTGFSSTSSSFGSIPKDGTPLGSSNTGSFFGLKNNQPSFGLGVSNNGNSSLFGTSCVNTVDKSESSKLTSIKEFPVETGEENEKAVFTAESVLFEFVAGAWKERGKGELKVNISTTGIGKARLVMRARGHYRLILNASLYPDLKLTNMDKKGLTFACVNSASECKDSLSTIALKFKDASLVEDFRAVVTEHKDKTPLVQKTPENSPGVSDE